MNSKWTLGTWFAILWGGGGFLFSILGIITDSSKLLEAGINILVWPIILFGVAVGLFANVWALGTIAIFVVVLLALAGKSILKWVMISLGYRDD